MMSRGLRIGDDIVWAAVQPDQVHAQQLAHACAFAWPTSQCIAAGSHSHTPMIGRWVCEEGLRLRQNGWSRQSGALVVVFVFA